MNTFNLSLDLDKSYTGEPVRLRQGDKRGTEIRAAIYDHGEPFTGSYTARYVQAIAGTGHEYYRADATFAAGVATVTVNEEYAAAVAGNTYGYFQFVSGSTVIASTQSFPVIILPDATAEAEVGERYDSAIEDALAELDEATGRISQMVIDATAEYLEAHPELTTTVEDNSLTDAKLIQHGGILQREQWLETMLPNIPRKVTSEADVHSVTDSAGGGPLGIEVYGRSVQDGTPTPDAPVPIQSVTPNLLDVSTLLAHGIGTTYTIGADGRVTVNASDTKSWVSQAAIDLPVGTYTIMREVNTGRMQLQLYDVGSTTPRQAVTLEANGAFSQTFTVTVPTQARFKVGFSASNYPFTTGVALYAGSVAYPYTPYGSIGLHAVGRNLWGYGNRTFTRYVRVNFDAPLPAGTYTVSAVVTSADTDASTSTFTFRDANDVAVGSATLTRNSRASDVVTIARPATYCYLYSSTGASSSTGDEATWSDIQIEVGSVAHAYEPYESVTIPIDLGGRSLRSLPDGTRDEVVVDEWGHAVLTQRVGVITIKQAHADGAYSYGNLGTVGRAVMYVSTADGPAAVGVTQRGGLCTMAPWLNSYTDDSIHAYVTNSGSASQVAVFAQGSTAAEVASKYVGAQFIYKRATPQTIDLGYIDPALLPAPDLTAYVVPSAPSVLKYGFDVAAAIAEIATA